MKKSIRRGVFETNSSSTHSITMCSKEDYNKWEKGTLLLDEDGNTDKQFVTKEEAIEWLKNNEYYKDLNFSNKKAVKEALRSEGFYTNEQYFGDEMETFEDCYTTKNGEKIIAFGKYGTDY